jgi:hypothetical protein
LIACTGRLFTTATRTKQNGCEYEIWHIKHSNDSIHELNAIHGILDEEHKLKKIKSQRQINHDNNFLKEKKEFHWIIDFVQPLEDSIIQKNNDDKICSNDEISEFNDIFWIINDANTPEDSRGKYNEEGNLHNINNQRVN